MTTKNSNNNLDCIAGRQSLVLLLLYGFVHVNEDEEMIDTAQTFHWCLVNARCMYKASALFSNCPAQCGQEKRHALKCIAKGKACLEM